jgi:phosphohistidine phosphatase
MRRLILFRHAKAAPRAPSGEDIDRPLDASGLHDAALMGRVLAEEGLSPDLALVSSSRRTRETWEQLASSFPKARAMVCDGLYNATAEEILAEIDAAADGAATVMVDAHKPGLHELAIELLEDASAAPAEIDKVAAHFPTSTAAAFRMDEAGRATPDGFFKARDYGGEDE